MICNFNIARQKEINEIIKNKDFDIELKNKIDELINCKIEYINLRNIKIYNPTLRQDLRETYKSVINIYDANNCRVAGFSISAIDEIKGNKNEMMIYFFSGEFEAIYFSFVVDQHKWILGDQEKDLPKENWRKDLKKERDD